MKTIVSFRRRDPYCRIHHYAKVVFLNDEHCFALIYKYVSMKHECIYKFPDIKIAMYEFHRVLMFLLSNFYKI